jgi:hypothetical protein
MRQQYLCLIYHEPAKLNALSDGEYEALVAEALAYRDELRRQGHLIAAEALEPADTATSLRVRNGKVHATDGPFAETKEHLGGFFLIEAGDPDEARALASRMPPLRLGTVEVRPIKDLERRQPGARR